jgi:hypothetical protein
MSMRACLIWCAVIFCFTVIVVASIVTPSAPPTPLQAGATKVAKSPDVYQKVFDQCIKAAKNQVRECKWTAENASEVVLYWDGSAWKAPQ